MLPRTSQMNARYKNPDNDPRGDWKPGDCVGSGVRKNGYYDVISPISGKVFNVPQGKHKANKEKEKNLIKYLIGADISLSNQKLTDNSSSEESEKEEKSDEIQI